jgi:hypothetical protein
VTRILRVEDNEDNIYPVKMRLEMIAGFDITVAKDGIMVAKDGAEGVDIAATDPPVLILIGSELADHGRVGGGAAVESGSPHCRRSGLRADLSRDGGRSRARARGGLRRVRHQTD